MTLQSILSNAKIVQSDKFELTRGVDHVKVERFLRELDHDLAEMKGYGHDLPSLMEGIALSSNNSLEEFRRKGALVEGLRLLNTYAGLDNLEDKTLFILDAGVTSVLTLRDANSASRALANAIINIKPEGFYAIDDALYNLGEAVGISSRLIQGSEGPTGDPLKQLEIRKARASLAAADIS